MTVAAGGGACEWRCVTHDPASPFTYCVPLADDTRSWCLSFLLFFTDFHVYTHESIGVSVSADFAQWSIDLEAVIRW